MGEQEHGLSVRVATREDPLFILEVGVTGVPALIVSKINLPQAIVDDEGHSAAGFLNGFARVQGAGEWGGNNEVNGVILGHLGDEGGGFNGLGASYFGERRIGGAADLVESVPLALSVADDVELHGYFLSKRISKWDQRVGKGL
jgi:hypothetical protein